MKKNWNKTYNQNGFNLENARKMELNAEDLMILRWFLDFYPLMEKVCVDNKEYGWVHYGYLLHNLQIIYYKEESVSKRFHKYCELGLIEKTVKNTKQGRKVYFRAVENITLLYTTHTDKNLDAHTDKNLDAHTDKNLDNSSTINSSTINSKKEVASDISLSQSNYSEIPKSSVVKEDLTTQFNEFWETYGNKVKRKEAEAKYKLAISKASHAQIMEGVRKYKEYFKLANSTKKWLAPQAPCVWLNGERWNDDFATLIKQEYEKQGKTAPQPTKSPAVIKEEAEAKEQQQRKYQALYDKLNDECKDLTDFFQKHLKRYFSGPVHHLWISKTLCGIKRNKNNDVVEVRFMILAKNPETWKRECQGKFSQTVGIEVSHRYEGAKIELIVENLCKKQTVEPKVLLF